MEDLKQFFMGRFLLGIGLVIFIFFETPAYSADRHRPKTVLRPFVRATPTPTLIISPPPEPSKISAPRVVESPAVPKERLAEEKPAAEVSTRFWIYSIFIFVVVTPFLYFFVMPRLRRQSRDKPSRSDPVSAKTRRKKKEEPSRPNAQAPTFVMPPDTVITDQMKAQVTKMFDSVRSISPVSRRATGTDSSEKLEDLELVSELAKLMVSEPKTVEYEGFKYSKMRVDAELILEE